MAPPLLLCMGAAKAGTSWLYRALHDHPACRLPAVKELHYWDTFEAGARVRQVAAFRARLAEIEVGRTEAEEAGRGWQAANRARQADHMRALIEMLEGPRENDALYRGYLEAIGQDHLTADMTPSYALLAPRRLARLVAALPGAAFVYLLRDPLARLWSHVRMQAARQNAPAAAIEEAANRLLRRVVEAGQERQIADRGDYAGAIDRLRATIPDGRLRIETIETVTEPGPWSAFCAWLGIAASTPDARRRVHAGHEVAMRPELRTPALAFLKGQYDWAARTLGEPPAAWRDNMARALA